jgi:hypothetical protein
LPVAVSARALSRASLPRAPELTPAPLPPTTTGVAFGNALGLELTRIDAKLDELARDAEAAEVAKREADAKDERERRPRTTSVPVLLTVYPPAVRIEIDGKRLAPGTETSLPPGRYHVTLTHTGCEKCAHDVRTLVVPEPAEDGTTRVTQHYDFARNADSIAPAQLFVECGVGAYVTDPRGRRYDCNVQHTVPRPTPEVELIILTAHAADGARLSQRQFYLSPKASIVWQL